MSDERVRDNAGPDVAAGAPGKAGPLWLLIGGVSAAAVVIAAAAALLVLDYHTHQHQRAEELLASSAADSALDLEAWLVHGYADVEIVATQSGIGERYARWRAGADPTFPQLLASRLEADRRIRGYASVAMLEPDGTIVAASPDEETTLEAEQAGSLIRRAVAADGPVFEDHFHGTDGDWMVAWAAPVRQSPYDEPIGFMVYATSMQAPAREFLGDDLLPYTSAASTLVRDHEGGSDHLSTVNGFMSETEQGVTALHVALAEGLASSDAVARYGETRDGTPALSAAHIVPGTGWFVSCRVDTAEVDAPVVRYGLLVGAAALFLMATVALGGTMVWRIRNSRYREYQTLIELKEALEARDRFLTNMSHELRTPLHSIMGFTSVMLGGLTGPLTDEQRHQLTMVDESSKRLLAMVDDVLDLGKIQANRMLVTITEFTTGEVEEVVCGLMRPLIARKSVTCEPDVEDPGIVLRTDQDMVERIVLNLVSNAIKFTDEGFVRVTIRPDGPEHVIFEVADSGRGIPADQLERIMEEFHQVVEPGGAKPVGTGLGLPISRKMAEVLGGSLSCESDVGHGSRFRLRIPRVHPGVE